MQRCSSRVIDNYVRWRIRNVLADIKSALYWRTITIGIRRCNSICILTIRTIRLISTCDSFARCWVVYFLNDLISAHDWDLIDIRQLLSTDGLVRRIELKDSLLVAIWCRNNAQVLDRIWRELCWNRSNTNGFQTHLAFPFAWYIFYANVVITISRYSECLAQSVTIRVHFGCINHELLHSIDVRTTTNICFQTDVIIIRVTIVIAWKWKGILLSCLKSYRRREEPVVITGALRTFHNTIVADAPFPSIAIIVGIIRCP